MKVYKLDIIKLAELDADKLKHVLVDLKKISDAVDNDVIKKLYLINLLKKLMFWF